MAWSSEEKERKKVLFYGAIKKTDTKYQSEK
jgi:hypothetical protein